MEESIGVKRREVAQGAVRLSESLKMVKPLTAVFGDCGLVTLS